MTTDSIEHDDEYFETFLGLIHSSAESARLDSAELFEPGFEPVEVLGLRSVLWRPPTGPLDGALLTEARALREIRPTIGDEKEERG